MTVGNGKKLSQIKFLVVVNLFVNRASHKPFLSTVRKNSKEKELEFKTKENT
jgi:hypothetical protein